jgi:hypothetical protein
LSVEIGQSAYSSQYFIASGTLIRPWIFLDRKIQKLIFFEEFFIG